MAAVNYPITGPPMPFPAPADGSFPIRIEIRDLQKNADQWNLYLLGLDAFKSLDETSDLSYYGIAGIHGRPYRPWGGVQGDNPGGWQGYCTHTSILFAPWHRPYLALFEQQLYGIIQDIASKFPAESQARYQAAAATFRIPYWDWAAAPEDGGYFPVSVGRATNVDVITPTSGGKTVSIPNPLYTNKFHPLLPGDFVSQPSGNGTIPYAKWTSTLRCPNKPTSTLAVSEEDQVVQSMTTQFASIQQNVNILLTDPNYTDFTTFSNHELINEDPGYQASLEDIHNGIHGAVGGPGGHMAELDYSAFDPVFWLHHVNVDRLFAIWQAINPTQYTFDRVDTLGGGTFVIPSGSDENTTTGLAPFNDPSGQNYWTSAEVVSTQTFGYAYPETQRWLFQNDSDYQNSIQNTIQQLYGGVSNSFANGNNFVVQSAPAAVATAPIVQATQVENQKPISDAAPAPAAKQESGFHPIKGLVHHVQEIFHHDESPPADTDNARGLDLEAEIGKPDENKPEPKAITYTDYIANIKTSKHGLGESYRVHIFLGEFTPDLKSWHTQDALVGTFMAFGKNTTPGDEAETGCGKCKKDAKRDVYITGTVPLTAQIFSEVQKGNCPSMDKENVLAYLTKNLHWRVTLADGSEYPRENVPGLTITVATTEVTIPVHGRPQRSGVYENHPEVTVGRPAGAST
ncbi:tyrosinase precursor [Mollisia scopiformis]|uniref:tyrosinase n=1 Tax=Mollisia scopiformis TaxID=149040 RepID=A0A194X431_MOLSC|nr:tyrosinase precursor [Mollisia scopiformis]KUJ14577.1 tyrosinase precursor [Mollisia scopiformis]